MSRAMIQGVTFAVVALVLIATSCAAPAPAPVPEPTPMPNLAFATPRGWPGSVVVSAETTSTEPQEAAKLTEGNPVYVSWAISDSNNVGVTTPFEVVVFVNGRVVHSWLQDHVAVGYPHWYKYLEIGPLAPGSYELSVHIDLLDEVRESIEIDNSLFRTITVHPGGPIVTSPALTWDATPLTVPPKPTSLLASDAEYYNLYFTFQNQGVDFNTLYNTYSEKGVAEDWTWMWIGNAVDENQRVYFDRVGDKWELTTPVTIQLPALPNLAFATPGGWPGPVVVSTETTSTEPQEATKLIEGEPIYVSWAILDVNNLGVTTPIEVVVSLNGRLVANELLEGAAVGYIHWYKYLDIGPLAPGSYELKVHINPSNVIKESYTADNYLVHSITVLPKTPKVPAPDHTTVKTLAEGSVRVPPQGIKWNLAEAVLSIPLAPSMHAHEAGIMYLVNGRTRHIINGKTLTGTSGQAVFFPSGELHTDVWETPAHTKDFYVLPGDWEPQPPLETPELRLYDLYFSPQPVAGLNPNMPYVLSLQEVSFAPNGQFEFSGSTAVVHVTKGSVRLGQTILEEGATVEIPVGQQNLLVNNPTQPSTALVAQLVPTSVPSPGDDIIWVSPSDEEQSLLFGAFYSDAPGTIASVTYTAKSDERLSVQAFQGQVFVEFGSESTVGEDQALIASTGADILAQFPLLGLYWLSVPPGSEGEFIDALNRSPLVVRAAPNQPAAMAQDGGFTDIDRWLRGGEPDLPIGDANIIQLDDWSWPVNGMSHGEAVGTLFGDQAAAKFHIRSDGWDADYITEFALMRAIRTAQEENRKLVVNITLQWFNPVAQGDYLRRIAKVLELSGSYHGLDNILVVLASGNMHYDLKQDISDIKKDYPQGWEHMLLVGATDAQKHRWGNKSDEPDDMVYAPAMNPQLDHGPRTSWAAPRVTKLLATLAAERPDLTWDQLKRALLDAAPLAGIYRYLPDLDKVRSKLPPRPPHVIRFPEWNMPPYSGKPPDTPVDNGAPMPEPQVVTESPWSSKWWSEFWSPPGGHGSFGGREFDLGLPWEQLKYVGGGGSWDQ